MMGYNQPHDQDHLKININMVEHFTNDDRRKFKPLTSPPIFTTTTSSSTGFIHLHPLNHHLMGAQRNKIEFMKSSEMVIVSSRWNPTPEQLQTLEELYRRGTRTPSADEIQRITTQLRRYGKIQGKNVFYWFQNHKARERQQRRRQLHLLHNHPTDERHQPSFYTTKDINLDQSEQQKDSEVEETRDWAIPTLSEKSVVVERRGQTESRMTKTDEVGMVYLEQQGNDHELLLLHQKRNIIWNHMMHSLSSASSSYSSSNNNHRTIYPSTLAPTASAPKTMELFPVNRYRHGKEQHEKCFVPMGDVGLGPRQFIEFLPLKN